MEISGGTRVVGLFGDPVAHSLSPRMQNAAIKASAIDAAYVPFHVTRANLAGAVDGIRRLDLLGANLTIPHKQAALALVDELDQEARLIGSINTIVNRNHRLCGCNTDMQGLLAALRNELKVDLTGLRVLLLGAGGAARAAAAAAAREGADWVGIANRSFDKAVSLADDMAVFQQGTRFAPLILDGDLAGRLPVQVDLLINATSVGLQGELHAFRLRDCLHRQGSVFDMVYGLEPTPLVREARAAGLDAADGLSMLAAQGEAGFQLWFERPAPPGVMRRALQGAFA